jgi:hypothetical protein
MIEKIVWSQKTIKINDLKDYDKNPRKISKDAFDRLVRDIQEDGYHSRIKANTDYTIIGGHARKKALLKAGYKSTDDIQVLIPDRTLSDEEFKRINIKDNLIFGDFDFDILANEFNQDDLIEWGMPADWLNVESQELNAGLTDDDAVPGLAEDAITVLGDVWVLGDHRLMCGDSTSIDSIEKLMQGNKVDMLFTDPPYNVGFNGRSGKFSIIENDNLPDNEFTSFIEEVCQTIKTINPNIYYIWCNWKFYGILQSQLTFKACIVWAKNVFGLGQGYRHQHEFCLFNGKVDDTIKDESDLWEIAKDSNIYTPLKSQSL